jgi:ABC-type bacteriocin/lantibiotic exporter with double-glycine peptidase domain
MMERRTAIKAALASTLALRTTLSNAGSMCSYPNQVGIQQCRAGIDSNVALAIARRQQNSQWCWAACIQMIFAYYGHDVSQKQIVQETWGGVVNMPASDQQILMDLNRTWSSGADIFSTTASPVDAASASWELSNNAPLIICTSGHAMVLTALDYLRDANGNGNVINAIVRDPWQDNGRRSLSPREWYATNLLAAVRCT